MDPFSDNNKKLNCTHCYHKNPMFDLLSNEELALFDNNRVEVSFKKGEIVYKQGTPLTHLVIIHSGLGKIFIEGPKEKNLILSYTKPHDINGGVGVFIDLIHHSSLVAASDCEICLIDINAFKEVFRSNQAFMEAYVKEYSYRVLQTYHQFAVLTQKNMEARMAEAILYLRENISDNGSIHNVSKLDLAEFTAMSKESAIRVLKEFKDEGYIKIEDHDIFILNGEALQKVAQYG